MLVLGTTSGKIDAVVASRIRRIRHVLLYLLDVFLDLAAQRYISRATVLILRNTPIRVRLQAHVDSLALFAPVLNIIKENLAGTTWGA